MGSQRVGHDLATERSRWWHQKKPSSCPEGLWPEWPPYPLEWNQSWAAPTLLLPSSWNILQFLVIIQGKCPPPQRGLSALQFNCLCELSVLSPQMFLSLKNGSLLKIVQAFLLSPVTRMWACEWRDGICLFWGSGRSCGTVPGTYWYLGKFWVNTWMTGSGSTVETALGTGKAGGRPRGERALKRWPDQTEMLWSWTTAMAKGRREQRRRRPRPIQSHVVEEVHPLGHP